MNVGTQTAELWPAFVSALGKSGDELVGYWWCIGVLVAGSETKDFACIGWLCARDFHCDGGPWGSY